MSEIESPETFWAHLCSHVTRYDAKHGLDFVLPLIRSRDRAVRAAALREAARVCDTVCDDYRNRRTTPNWTAEDAAERIRALATKEPTDD